MKIEGVSKNMKTVAVDIVLFQSYAAAESKPHPSLYKYRFLKKSYAPESKLFEIILNYMKKNHNPFYVRIFLYNLRNALPC